MNETDKIALFAYGTLQRGQSESSIFDAATLGVQSARIKGKLLTLQEGYPILQIDAAQIIKKASVDAHADWRAIAETWKPPPTTSAVDPADPWVEGQLISLSANSNTLDKADEWECFQPGSDSAYQRVIATAINGEGVEQLCWLYACMQPPAGAKPLEGNRWIRPENL